MRLTITGLFTVVSLLVSACTAPRAAPTTGEASRPASAGAPAASAAAPAPAPAAEGESLDALYEQAKAEGGVLSLYGTINIGVAPTILAAFEQRFPGVKVDWVDATSDQLLARIVSEARGGKVLADVLQTNIESIADLERQGLLTPFQVPEAEPYPPVLKGASWLASDLKFLVAAWNTQLVQPSEVPRQYEDFADPRWRNRLAADASDFVVLAGLAKHKYNSDERANELLRQIAANNVEFHRSHARLVDLVVAGQAAVCLTCFSHNIPPQMSKGAPVDYWLTEGIGTISANAILKNAPHPQTAQLWVRWVASEEGQQAYATAGATPAHPGVEPVLKTRPERIYPFGMAEIAEQQRYERAWREIFQLR